jgi:hypothetical protein
VNLTTIQADHGERAMIESNASSADLSLVAKGREFLERGDIASAVECYGRVFDPDTVDESEARSMLIEARSHLSRKHVLEALECFEEALIMGTEVQRRQALDGIASVGEIRSRLGALTTELKKGLKQRLGKKSPASSGLALVSDQENVVLISDEAIAKLPSSLTRGSRITKLPQHMTDMHLPLQARHCIPYAHEDDVRYILDVAAHLSSRPSTERDTS